MPRPGGGWNVRSVCEMAQMGRMAADALLGRMLGRETTAPEEMTVPTTLVVRGSTVPVDRAALTS